jgi:hypothetical protein
MNEISKDLERYYKNKEKYNERAKKYYNEIWYPKNKERLKKERKEKSKKKIKEIILEEKIIYTNNDKNLIVNLGD